MFVFDVFIVGSDGMIIDLYGDVVYWVYLVKVLIFRVIKVMFG